MKESFLIYKSFYEPIKELSLEEKGLLLDAIFNFQLTGDEPEISNPIRIPFAFFKNQFRLDTIKYEKTVLRNRENGKKGGRPKGTDNEVDELNPEQPKKPNGLNGNPEQPKKPDNDNDNDNEKGNDNDYRKSLMSDLQKSDFSLKSDIEYFQITKAFYTLFERNLKEADASLATLEKAKGAWIDHVRRLINIDKNSQENIRIVFDFLKTNKFWKSKILSTSKLRDKFTTLLMDAKTEKNGKGKSTIESGCSKQELASVLHQNFDETD